MDVNNLPNPIDTVDGNVTEYIDYNVIVDQIYYYRIGAYRNNDVMISDEIEVVATPTPSTIDTHDVFGDGSAIATYQFNGNINDLGGLYDLTVISGNEQYITSGRGSSFKFDGNTQLRLSNSINHIDGITYSFWSSDIPSSVELIFEGSSTGSIMLHTNIDGFRFNGMEVGRKEDFIVDKTGTNHWVFMSSLNEIVVYKNSSHVETRFISGSTISTNYINVGSRDNKYNFNGDLDQVRIFNRSLTPEEVNALYEEGLN